MKKRVVITGGSGFLGSALSTELLARGFQVTSLDLRAPRVKGVSFVEANLARSIPEHELLMHPHAVINLAGRPIFSKWDDDIKRSIYDSRVLGTRALVAFFKKTDFRPRILLNASAVGIYGDRGEMLLTEESASADSFLATVAHDWEREALKAEALGVRVCCMRNGYILDSRAGMLATLLPFYRMGVGGPLSSGEQWFPWIHIKDAFHSYIWALQHPSIHGAVNVCAPELMRNRDFSKKLAKALVKPHFLFVPAPVLRLLYGELATEMLASAKVSTRLARGLGFHFSYPTLDEALNDLV